MKFALGATAAAMVALAPLYVSAQQPAKAECAAVDASFPAPFASWGSKADFASADKVADLSKASLTVGKAVTAVLHPTREVKYASQPEKPGGSVAHGGMFEVKIDKAGTYRVGIGSGAWIDMLQNGKVLESTAHGPGPACTTVRKTVAFQLKPGRYVLQLSGNADPKLAVIVANEPAG